ncbi:MAG: tRNA 4-thiouridine(8) synthase ThiI [Candidatus Lokiarchaeota archaeon]|nr:tRNA 4-thiouridine(8) synthase ThiI [Candidatus Lokiarchaeota archaeon]
MQDMKISMILIRYGEIGLKSPKTRISWEKLLISNIKSMMELNNIDYERITFSPTRGRIFIKGHTTDKLVQGLKKVSGITSFSEVEETKSELKLIEEAVIKKAKEFLKNNDSFALRVNRVGDHPYTSIEVAQKIGREILDQLTEKEISVNLDNPDKEIYIDIRDKKSYIFTEKIAGMGGLPIGSQGKLVSLLSGGIDSPVATWLMMKRGCVILPVFFDAQPYSSEKQNEKIRRLIKLIRKYDPRKNYYYYVCNHGDNLKYLIENAPSRYTCLLCKRLMYRIAEVIAKKENAKGIITGENMGQVASQTLYNLEILDNVINLPIYRPVIGFDKQEIIQIAQNIGTFDISTETADICTAVPESPIIRGSINKVKNAESDINIKKLVKKTTENIRKIQI